MQKYNQLTFPEDIGSFIPGLHIRIEIIHSVPSVYVRTYPHQEERNVSFSEIFAFVQN